MVVVVRQNMCGVLAWTVTWGTSSIEAVWLKLRKSSNTRGFQSRTVSGSVGEPVLGAILNVDLSRVQSEVCVEQGLIPTKHSDV